MKPIGTTTTRTESAVAARPPRTGITMIGLSLIMLLAVLDQTIVATSLPSIAADLHGLGQLSWVVNAYLLGVGLAAPLYGKLGDMYGRKPIIMIAVSLFTLASAASGASQSMTELIVFRAIQGLGGGGLMNLTTAAVADLVPPSERGKVQGYTGAVFALGSIGGPLLGGLLTGSLGWRWVFYVNVPVALAGMVIVARYFRVPRKRTAGRLDWPGALLLAAAVTAVLLVTDWAGQQYAWGSWQIIALAAAAVLALAGFALVESRAANPVIPPRLWRDPVFRVAIPSSGLLGVGLFGTVVFLPQFFQVVKHASPIVSGALLAPTMFAAVVAGVFSAVRASATGNYRKYPIIGALLLIAGFCMLIGLSPDSSSWLTFVGTLLLGLGVGCQMQLMVLIVQNAVPARDLGAATASTMLFRSIGGAVGTALFSTLLLRRFDARLHTIIPNATQATAGTIYHALVTGIGPGLGSAHEAIVRAFGQSVSVVFVWAIPFAVALLVLGVLLPGIPLRKTVQDKEDS